MKLLNLANEERSDIIYQVSKFPDGQQQLSIKGLKGIYDPREGTIDNILIGDLRFKVNIPNFVVIKSRFNNFSDLELIICAVKSLRSIGVKRIELYVPYFLGSRSDRVFEFGSNNYLKDVICPIINSLKLDKVTVLDPHSDVLEALLDNYQKKDNIELVQYALNEIKEEILLISPDGGSLKKIYKLADAIEYKGHIITCSKFRQTDGTLSNVHVPITSRELDKHFVIIDDICDGGRTFINIAKEIKKWRNTAKISLIVTHGIFSAGYKELTEYFENIYTTNSYKDVGDMYVLNSMGTIKSHNIKQINIF